MTVVLWKCDECAKLVPVDYGDMYVYLTDINTLNGFERAQFYCEPCTFDFMYGLSSPSPSAA